MTRWEYKVAVNPSQDEIDWLGLDGWEMCGIQTKANPTPPFPVYTRDYANTIFHFKRARTNTET